MKLEKLTRRAYGDACGTAHGLELVGDRWALLVMRELMLGSRRFGSLRDSLPGISANVLAQRLEELEAAGVLVRRRLPPPASAQVYELTPWGYEAEPVIQALGRWAARSPAHDPTLPISAVSVLLSFRTMLDPARADGIDARIGFRFGEDAYVGHLSPAGLDVRRGEPEACDLVLTATPPALAAVVYGGAPLDLIGVEGNRALAERFRTLFPLPPKAGSGA